MTPSGLSRPWRNVAFRTVAEGAARVFNFLLSVIGARLLGVVGWGTFWSGFSYAQVLALFTDLGGHLTLSRAVARDRRNARKALGASLVLKLALSAVALAAWALSGGFPRIPLALQGVLIGAALCISYVEWLGFHLRGFGRVPAESVLLAADCLAAFILGVASLLRANNPLSFALSQAAAHLAVLLGAYLFYSRERDFRPVLPRLPRLLSFFRESFPTGLAVFSSLGSWRLGILALAALPGGSVAAAGIFAAAHRILEAARFFPSAAASSLFPSFAAGKPGARPGRFLMVLLPLALAVTAAANIPRLSLFSMSAIYGNAYFSSAPLLSALFFAFPLMTLNWVLSHWLIARGMEKRNALASVIQLATHALLLWYLVPAYGAFGAAWSLVGAEAALSLSLLLFPVFP